jgi:hypothetical protein
MIRTFYVTQSPSLPVIQAAYQELLATETCTVEEGRACHIETVYLPVMVRCGFLFFPPPQIILPTQPPAEDWLKFQRLLADWKGERGAMSSITEAATCPAYQSIIGMGETAILFILAQLESEGEDPDQWFWALAALTGANPVADEDRGNYQKMAQSWLKWGRDNGYAR